MDRHRLQDALQAAGMLGVIASLVFVGLELKQSREIAVAQVYQARAALDIEIRNNLAPSEAVYDALGSARRGETLDGQQSAALRTGLGNLFIYWETNHRLHELGLLDDEHWAASLRAMRYASHIPGLASAWREERASFRTSFQDVVERQLSAEH